VITGPLRGNLRRPRALIERALIRRISTAYSSLRSVDGSAECHSGTDVKFSITRQIIPLTAAGTQVRGRFSGGLSVAADRRRDRHAGRTVGSHYLVPPGALVHNDGLCRRDTFGGIAPERAADPQSGGSYLSRWGGIIKSWFSSGREFARERRSDATACAISQSSTRWRCHRHKVICPSRHRGERIAAAAHGEVIELWAPTITHR